MMDLITGLKSLWPDFKISVNDLQQPSTQLIVNFVKRSVEELGLNGRIFEHKTEPLNDVMYCFNFINYCFSLSDREIDLTLDSILEPKRTQTKALIGYLYFFILNEKEKRNETEKIQDHVDEFVNEMNTLISRRDELKQKKLDQQQFLLDNDKKLIEIEHKKQSILQEIEPLKKSISVISDRKKKLVDDLNNESEYNSQIMKEKSSLQDKIQMKLDEIVDEKFYAISEKNRDETRENIALIEHDFNEIVANLEQKRSLLKHYEEIIINFENYLKNFNKLSNEDFCSISKIEQKCDEDVKLIRELKEHEKKIREQIDTKLTTLSQLQMNFEKNERHFIEKKDSATKQIDRFNSELSTLKHQIEDFTTKITDKLLELRLIDTDSFLTKYSEDDLSRTLHSVLVDNSDFDNLPNHDFIQKVIECNDLFLNRLANRIDDEKREIASINREFEMIKYAMCKVVDHELSVYPKMGKSLRLSNK